MSLINDALKRAKEAQQKNPPPPPPDLPLRPVEATQPPKTRKGMVLPMVCGAVFALVTVLLWQGSRRQAIPPQSVPPVLQRVLPTQGTLVAVVPPQPPVPSVQTVLASPPASAPGSSIPATQPAEVTAPPAPVSGTVSTPTAPLSRPPDSNAPSVTVVTSPPQPPPLKLQGILYRQTNPLVVINGKTVGVGGRVGEATVTAIHPDSTDVVVAGETIKLSLP